MSTFTADQPLIVADRYDTTSDVGRVVEATRHLCDHRAGLAEALEHLAEAAVARMPDEGARMLEPLLRALGPDLADDYARRLYVGACHVVGHWDPDHDVDRAAEELRRLTHEAAHAVADRLGDCTRICCNAHRASDAGGGGQL